MTVFGRLAFVLLLLATNASNPIASSPAPASGFAAAGAHDHDHAVESRSDPSTHVPTISAAGSHECPHCPARGCSTDDRCAAGAAVALAAAPGALDLLTSVAGAPRWVTDRPQSANPTPPIPPPQRLL